MTKQTALVFIRKGYEDIENFLNLNFDCEIIRGEWDHQYPQWLLMGIQHGSIREFDWIFSFLFPARIPKEILDKATKGAINFHSAPPKYPGIGGYNYAIWNDDKEYGVTAHLMNEKIDDGEIIELKYFDLIGNETVEILKNRTIVVLKKLFYNQMRLILKWGHLIKVSYLEEWGDYKSRADFQEFCNIHDEILDNYEDLERKLRATYFKGARDLPYININMKKWVLIPEKDIK